MADNVGGRPTVIDDAVLAKLQQAFQMGFTMREACVWANIAVSTYYDYRNSHEGFAEQVEEWRQNPVLKARSTLYNNLDKIDTARWFLERKKKKEFSTRTEFEGDIGVVLPQWLYTGKEKKKTESDVESEDADTED